MTEKKKDSYSIGSTLRDRGKKPVSDIGELWLSQKKSSTKSSRKPKRQRKINKLNLSKLKSKFTKPKKLTKLKLVLPKLSNTTKTNKIGMISIGAVLVLVFFVNFISKDENNTTSQQLGASANNNTSTSDETTKQEKIAQVKETEFELIWPNGASSENTDVVLVSPPENEPVYAYITVFKGAELRVSQQKIPESFKDDVEAKVKEVAESFQALNIIQIDDTKVYHGFSDKYGEVQSLIFEKNGLLVLIASPVKFDDTTWVGYISSLK